MPGSRARLPGRAPGSALDVDEVLEHLVEVVITRELAWKPRCNREAATPSEDTVASLAEARRDHRPCLTMRVFSRAEVSVLACRRAPFS